MVTEEGVACGFERRDSFVYATLPERREDLAREAEAMQQAGLLDTELLEDLRLPVEVAAAERLPGQAQFHPQRWLLHLAAQLEQAGGQVVEGVVVLNTHERDGILLVETATGSPETSAVRT